MVIFSDTRKGQTTTITHIQNSIACLSRVHAMASSFLLSCTYHASTSRPAFDLFSVRSFPALALAAFGSCQPQDHSQAPASHLASPSPSLCRCLLLSAPSLTSHLTSPKPPLRRRRLHSAPSSAPLVITTTAARSLSSTSTTNHHLLNHHARSGGRARPAPFSLTPPDRHRPSALSLHN